MSGQTNSGLLSPLYKKQASLERLVGTDTVLDDVGAGRSGIWVPTSADELACVTNLPLEFMQSHESKQTLDTWSELGTYMAPCLRSLLVCAFFKVRLLLGRFCANLTHQYIRGILNTCIRCHLTRDVTR